nr:putative reverse transcriptase, RNA-dependent DNA polymerase [Tanacetum cinerariifolium]
MARLAFCDYHNMIAILEKYELNTDFHQIEDFVEASHLRYALTFNPTVYVSHIRQFWSTARIETMDGGTKILATIDGKLRTISESSIRRNLKLKDKAGISSLPDAELFENLTLMRYNILPNQKFSFQKGRRLISWQCKKQTNVATSKIEAEYVAAASCCGQVMRIQNQLLDYGLSMPYESLSREFSTSILRLLQFCDYHNMVAILEKSEHNIDFHPMVDFIEASPLRIETTDEGTQILATVDGIHRTVTESSLRRNIKLKDEEGISSLPDTELFENLTLMGYNISPNQKFTFQKGQFSHQWKYLIHTIMQCISLKSIGFNEFSSNITTALICLATNRTYNFSKMIFDGLVKNVNNKGEGSGTPTEPHHTPSPEAQSPLHTTHTSPTLPHVTTTSIPTVTP